MVITVCPGGQSWFAEGNTEKQDTSGSGFSTRGTRGPSRLRDWVPTSPNPEPRDFSYVGGTTNAKRKKICKTESQKGQKG